MNGRAVITPDCVPRLAPHMRLRFDKARAVWAIQAPERTFMLDDIAHAIVARCDGAAAVAQIVEGLCGDFPDAPRAAVERDVLALLQDFSDKGVIRA